MNTMTPLKNKSDYSQTGSPFAMSNQLEGSSHKYYDQPRPATDLKQKIGRERGLPTNKLMGDHLSADVKNRSSNKFKQF
jgi:hypothetical protein